MVKQNTNAVATNVEMDEWGGGLVENVLSEITTFDEAVAKFGDKPVLNAADMLGDGFSLVKDKMSLVGVPFMVLRYKFHMGTHGTFVTMHVITNKNDKLIINDGSTGIASQVQELDEKFQTNWLPMAVNNGLRVSDYEYTDDKGNEKSARTFYLDSSK
jgi:hypothetical protein